MLRAAFPTKQEKRHGTIENTYSLLVQPQILHELVFLNVSGRTKSI